MRSLVAIALVVFLSAFASNFSDVEYTTKLAGKTYGHQFEFREDIGLTQKAVFIPVNAPSILSGFGARYGTKGGSRGWPAPTNDTTF